MNPFLMQSITQALPAILISSIAGSLNYLAWRFIKNRLAIFVLALVALYGAFQLTFICFFGPTTLNAYATGNIYTFLLVVFSMIGGYFHSKSNDSPRMIVKDFLLLLAASYSTFAVVIFLDSYRRATFNGDALVVAYISVLSSPSIAPILICAWKSMKLRPGIDKPLSD